MCALLHIVQPIYCLSVNLLHQEHRGKLDGNEALIKWCKASGVHGAL